jgi:6-phosphogluconolactonase (cycloisomerase 2 family)
VTGGHDLSLNHNDNTLSVYSVASDGTLLEKAGSPYNTSTINPLSVQAVNTNPAGQNNSGGVFVYVGAAGNATGAVDAFQLCTTVNSSTCSQTDVNNAKLIAFGTPTSAGQNPVGMVVDPTNNFLYVTAEQTSELFGFNINSTTGVLKPLSPASLPTGSNPVAVAMHSTGKFLYTSNSNSNNISAFTLSLTNGSMATGATANTPSAPSGMTAR